MTDKIMIKFACKNCHQIIEDYCGEVVDTDDNGIIISYICPYCGKEIKTKNSYDRQRENNQGIKRST